MARTIKILETFRDAIQGIEHLIPAERKVEAIRLLLNLGFDYLDAGSFVSPKHIPQFADMDAVLEGLADTPSSSNLFILTGTPEGASRACSHARVDAIGFPFSTSETFLKKNINTGFTGAWERLEAIKATCDLHGKELMVYLAMAFGNPYGDPAGLDACMKWGDRLSDLGVTSIHLSDIIGVAEPRQVATYFRSLNHAFSQMELGIHLHTKDDGWKGLLSEAAENGCTIFDGVITGLGGCPMTGYEMLRNLPTSNILDFAEECGLQVKVEKDLIDETREKILKIILA